MRKIIALFAVLLLCSPLAAQVPVTGAGKGAPGGGFTPSCSQSSAFIARSSLSNNTDKTNYDTLICGMVTDGTFAKLDAMWMLVAPDATTQGLNLVSSSFTLTPHNYIFVAKTPVTGDTTSLSFQTGFTPSTSGTNFVQNSASIGACHTNTRTTGQTWASLGISDGGSSVIRMIPLFGSPSVVGGLNGNQYVASVADNLPALVSQDRSGSTTTDIYRNGTSINTDSTGSNSPNTHEVFLLAENNGSGVATTFTGDTIAMLFIGGSLGATLQGNLRTRVNTFLTAYSVGNC